MAWASTALLIQVCEVGKTEKSQTDWCSRQSEPIVHTTRSLSPFCYGRVDDSLRTRHLLATIFGLSAFGGGCGLAWNRGSNFACQILGPLPCNSLWRFILVSDSASCSFCIRVVDKSE